MLLERAILAYFVVEILVDFRIIEGRREFLEEKWVDLILILPFFTLFREVGRLLSALKVLKPAKGLKTLKAPKTVKLTKLLESRKLAKKGNGVQEAGHLVKKGKGVVRKGRDVVEDAVT